MRITSHNRRHESQMSKTAETTVNAMDHDLPSHDITPTHWAHWPLGAHLVTPRRGYTHHGIYVGNGIVIHYAGSPARAPRPRAADDAVEFADGHAVDRGRRGAKHSGDEAAQRAHRASAKTVIASPPTTASTSASGACTARAAAYRSSVPGWPAPRDAGVAQAPAPATQTDMAAMTSEFLPSSAGMPAAAA